MFAPVEETVSLSDGRTLSYAVYGDPDGFPLVMNHGTPGSRKTFHQTDELANIKGLKLILPERPGYGLSSPAPLRTLPDWGRDIEQLADALDIKKFAVAGESGGGPHALAIAHHLPDRVTKAFLLASPAPYTSFSEARDLALSNRLMLQLTTKLPGIVAKLTAFNAMSANRDPEVFIESLARQLGPADAEFLRDEQAKEIMAEELKEAYRQGPEAQTTDGLLVQSFRPWGFNLAEIQTPTISWHGDQDRLVPKAMADRLQQLLPNCQITHLPDAGHILSAHPKVVQSIASELTTQA